MYIPKVIVILDLIRAENNNVNNINSRVMKMHINFKQYYSRINYEIMKTNQYTLDSRLILVVIIEEIKKVLINTEFLHTKVHLIELLNIKLIVEKRLNKKYYENTF